MKLKFIIAVETVMERVCNWLLGGKLDELAKIITEGGDLM